MIGLILSTIVLLSGLILCAIGLSSYKTYCAVLGCVFLFFGTIAAVVCIGLCSV